MLKNRYKKNHQTISESEQDFLSTKHIAIIGCGGLGQHTASQLCRIGIGSLTLIDPDVFDETNLNRQLFCHTGNIGVPKVFEAEQQLKLINPDVKIKSFSTRFAQENSHEVLAGSDIALDALDSIKDRLILQKACKELNIPLVSAAIGGWYGQFLIVMPGDDTLNIVYPEPDLKGVETELGNPAFIPALMASIQVSETVKLLLGKSNLTEGEVLYIDLLNLVFERYSTTTNTYSKKNLDNI